MLCEGDEGSLLREQPENKSIRTKGHKSKGNLRVCAPALFLLTCDLVFVFIFVPLSPVFAY